MSDEKKPKPKATTRTVMVDPTKYQMGRSLSDLILEQERQRESMMKTISSLNLDYLKTLYVPNTIALDLARSISSKILISENTLLKQAASWNTSSILQNQMDLANMYKSTVDSSMYTFAQDILRTNKLQMSEILSQATLPIQGLDIFSNSLSKFNFQSIYSSAISNADYLFNEDIILKSTYQQFRDISELDWSPILRVSAAVSIETAASDFAFPLSDDGDSALSEDTVLTIDEARESIFSSIEILDTETAEKMQVAFRFLWTLETEIRRFIQNVMTVAVGQNWETSHLPGDMFDQWKEKHTKGMKNGRSPQTALIEFADFTDYLPLITNKKNWQFFKNFFGNAELVTSSFKRLFPYRLDTMHGRIIPEREIVILAGDCEWLLLKLGVAEGLSQKESENG